MRPRITERANPPGDLFTDYSMAHAPRQQTPPRHEAPGDAQVIASRRSVSALRDYREAAAEVYDTYLINKDDVFWAEAEGRECAGFLFTDLKCAAARFRRTEKHLSPTGDDFMLLHAQLAGEELLHMEHGVMRLLPGQIYLRDWRFPFDSQVTEMHIRSVLIPRTYFPAGDRLRTESPMLSWDMHSLTGQALWALWNNLHDTLADAPPDEAKALCIGFAGFLGAMLGQQGSGHAPPSATLSAIEHHVQARLRGAVTVSALCEHFEVSRATIFRLLKPHGGLQRYVYRMRLERCLEELKKANPRVVSVSEIAAGWGFGDANTFSRKFRAHFACAPSDVLGHDFRPTRRAKPVRSGAPRSGKRFVEFKKWLHSASKP